MKVSVLILLAYIAAPAVSEKVTPVQKVLGLMNDMLAKGKKDKAEEQVRFSTYMQFCQSTSGEKTRAIAAGKSAILQLTADIEKAGADSMMLAKEIAKLGADMDEFSAQKAEALAIRAKDHADFAAVHADYVNSIDAVDRALQVLSTGPGLSLVQKQQGLQKLLTFGSVSIKTKQALMSFLKGDVHDASEAMLEEGLTSGQTPKTYESSSGGVIDMVKDLGKKFKEEKYELEKAEAKKQHASDMIVGELTSSIDSTQKQLDEKTSFKSQREKDKAEAEGSLADTQATLAGDEKFLADLTAECDQKAKDFEARQGLRAGEIEALMKAIEIMTSGAISGGTQHLPSLAQQGVALAQLRADVQNPVQKSVARFLKDRALQSKSKILSLVAVRVAEDPFKKIKKMIEDMVTKLMEEANEEAEHKGFCDKEMGTNKATRDTKTEEIEELTAFIEETTAAISKLGEEIAALADDIAALDAAVGKATSERTAEKEKNTATIADAQAAGLATARALTVLKDFYAGAAGATALVQKSVKAQKSGQPETFDKPYTGMGGSAGGVVGMLEVIQSDFTRLETETATAEDSAAKEYETFMRDSSQDKAVKMTSSKHKTGGKAEKESELANAKKDLKGTQEELDAAMEYFEKLKPSCVEAGESYEERVARRKEEIESLQDALKILSGEA